MHCGGGPRADMPESACRLCYYLWTSPRSFSSIENEERCQSSQISAYSLCYPISKNNLKQFYLGAVLPVAIRLHCVLFFLPKKEQICPEKKEKVDFLGHILLKYYCERIFNFSPKKFSFVPF